jgi:hypothetical protein
VKEGENMTKEELEKLCASGEASWLDWKADFPPSLLKGKSDSDSEKGRGTLLKDLVSIANGTGEQYGYLVYGVKDERTVRIVKGTEPNEAILEFDAKVNEVIKAYE